MADVKTLSDQELKNIAGIKEPAKSTGGDLSSFSDAHLLKIADPERPSITLSGPTELKKPPSKIPGVAQFVGGIVAGGLAAFITKHPAAVATARAVGGTVGRGVGILGSKALEAAKDRPVKTATQALLSPTLPLIDAYSKLDPEEKTKFNKHMKVTSINELVGNIVGLGVVKGGSKLLRGATTELLGQRVVERGTEVGWKKLLNPAFFKDRVPKTIATKMDKFFTKLSGVTGKKIDTLLKTKYKNSSVVMRGVKDRVNALAPQGKPIFEHIDDMLISKNKKDLLKSQIQKINSMGGRTRKVHTLWTIRKKLDNVLLTQSWDDESYKLVSNLRNVFNAEIKGVGPDVGHAFGRYSFVKTAELDLGKKLSGLRDPSTGEIYSQNLERFTKNLLSTDKDETIRLLKDLDKLNSSNNRIIETLLDYSAAEGLERGKGLGIWQQMMVGMLGGRKSIARIGAVAQSPITKALRKGAGRAITVGTTELTTEKQ